VGSDPRTRVAGEGRRERRMGRLAIRRRLQDCLRRDEGLSDRRWVGRQRGRRCLEGGRSAELWERKVEGKMEKQRGVKVFIVRESGESANTLRHARTGRAKPERGHTRLEAAKCASFTRTNIILK